MRTITNINGKNQDVYIFKMADDNYTVQVVQDGKLIDSAVNVKAYNVSLTIYILTGAKDVQVTL